MNKQKRTSSTLSNTEQEFLTAVQLKIVSRISAFYNDILPLFAFYVWNTLCISTRRGLIATGLLLFLFAPMQQLIKLQLLKTV